MPPEKFKSYIKIIEKGADPLSPKEQAKKDKATASLAQIELLRENKGVLKQGIESDKPKNPEKEKIKKEKAKETLAKIEAMKTLEDQELLAKLNRDFEGIDELIKNTEDAQIKKTLAGLKLALEEAKNPTEIKKFLDQLKNITDKKSF